MNPITIPIRISAAILALALGGAWAQARQGRGARAWGGGRVRFPGAAGQVVRGPGNRPRRELPGILSKFTQRPE